ncbi:MAG TPA: nucleotide pyrophosphohydrolase [Coriobacteriia bacterium]|nr:nucleotide pyrophosphohydrolase [Coriobacteriia bacterium]
MLDELTKRIVEFRDERDWKQFHSPRNLAASISIEAAELLELFQWSSDATVADDLKQAGTDLDREIADIVIYCLLLAHDTGVDVQKAIDLKLAENAAKYPAEKALGNRRKYTEL